MTYSSCDAVCFASAKKSLTIPNKSGIDAAVADLSNVNGKNPRPQHYLEYNPHHDYRLWLAVNVTGVIDNPNDRSVTILQ